MTTTAGGSRDQLEVIPGEWVCPECGYFESKAILNPSNGTSGPNPEPALPCPNDGEFMIPLTWKQHALDLRKMIDGLLSRTPTQHEAWVILDKEIRCNIPCPRNLTAREVPDVYNSAIEKLIRNAEGK